MTQGLRIVCTHVMYAVFVWVLPSSLVFEQRQQELFPESRVGVQEERPGRKDDIDRVDVLHHMVNHNQYTGLIDKCFLSS